MRRAHFLFAATLLLFFSTGCTTVQTDSAARFNIHAYQTYQLVYIGNTNAAAFNNPLNARRLQDAVTARLTQLGLTPVAEGQPADCTITVSTGSRQVLEATPATPRLSFGLGWYGRGWHSAMAFDNDMYTYGAYDEHRISIDITDGKSNAPVWHTTINKNINLGSGASAELRIQKIADQLLAQLK